MLAVVFISVTNFWFIKRVGINGNVFFIIKRFEKSPVGFKKF